MKSEEIIFGASFRFGNPGDGAGLGRRFPRVAHSVVVHHTSAAASTMDGLAWPKPSVVHFSEAFVICAGSVLFRRDAEDQWQICVLHDPVRHIFVLPKGRKDCGETTEDAAVRETYEETGYPCKLLPCAMMTRAPPPNANMVDKPRAMQGAMEPFAVTLRDQNGTKIIWWYLTIVNGEKEEGTQTASENYRSEFIASDEALKTLTFQDDRNIVHRALALVQSCYP